MTVYAVMQGRMPGNEKVVTVQAAARHMLSGCGIHRIVRFIKPHRVFCFDKFSSIWFFFQVAEWISSVVSSAAGPFCFGKIRGHFFRQKTLAADRGVNSNILRRIWGGLRLQGEGSIVKL